MCRPRGRARNAHTRCVLDSLRRVAVGGKMNNKFMRPRESRKKQTNIKWYYIYKHYQDYDTKLEPGLLLLWADFTIKMNSF